MLDLKRITKKCPDYKGAKRIFLSAFPRSERPPYPFLYYRSKAKGNDYLGIYDGDTLVGMTYVISTERIAYIFFLAIDGAHRGKGYGTETLKLLFKEHAGKKIVLAIEEIDESAENYPERVRRLKFYKRCGFQMSGYKLREVNMVYDLLTLDSTVTPADYTDIPKTFLGKFLAKFFKMELFK